MLTAHGVFLTAVSVGANILIHSGFLAVKITQFIGLDSMDWFVTSLFFLSIIIKILSSNLTTTGLELKAHLQAQYL